MIHSKAPHLPAGPRPPKGAAPQKAVPALPARHSAPQPSAGTKLLLVDFRSGEAVAQHPEVAALLHQGWQIRSAVPRIVEAEGPKLLVILMQQGAGAASVDEA